MNVLITGYFNDHSKQQVIQSFPNDWPIHIVEPHRIEAYIGDAEVLIPEHIEVNDTLLDQARSLKFVQTGAGFDNVDIEACTRRGIWVSNAAGVNANAVAEHIMAFILSYYKNISYLDRFMKNKGDETRLSYTGGELSGRTIGTIGYGAIGSRVGELAQAFKMKVLAYDKKMAQNLDQTPGKSLAQSLAENPALDPALDAAQTSVQPPALPRDSVEWVNLDTLLANSDVVTINIFLDESTRNLVDRTFLSKMKTNALLVNTARGPIVCEEDLIEALKHNIIGGACLDVFTEEPLSLNSELRSLDNVILTPHTAGMPDGMKFHETRYRFFVDNIVRVKNNETPKNNLNQLN
ncbi:NAD(P)-dependent oxidoreductase [Paenibacillus eucommiae]|uniref:D-3-phosphoglycerate dehydrogenase n=1 Tax=Paenibacillus eucommiae TaxID=1355755 RepID=A0ABS4IZB2_9BACL|nr:NAD(P)-dependent oxidoreductase [Paenibacillus eucommiae]MBP1992932.1 D-3-phosphoglycerate dehydrogenase [Paenibacillus eucommiae]